jgi:hypothetical protein
VREPVPEAAGPEVIALDGKTSRRTQARAKGWEPLHLLSAWARACRQRLVLGQQAVEGQAVEGKSNEITAIPALLERLELAGALVTTDAIGTRTAIAETIRRSRGDDLLALKANRPLTCGEVAAFFADPPPALARKNVAVIQHSALNLLRRAKPTTSLKNRRKLTGWSLDHLENPLRGSA